MTGIVVLMNEEEARECVREIKEGITSVRQRMLDLEEREGWKSLGYANIAECVEKEFGFKKSQTYDLLTAARTERTLQIPTRVNSGAAEKPVATKTLLKVAKLPTPSQQKKAWNTAVVANEGKQPTAVQVETAVKSTIFTTIPDKFRKHLSPLPENEQVAVWQWAIGLWKRAENIAIARFLAEINKRKGTTPSTVISSSPASPTHTPSQNLSPNTAVPAPAASLSSFSPAVCDTCLVSLVVIGTADDLGVVCPKCGGSFCTNC